tara:strand:+ start:2518 stop:2679 length:162 start_codon:yes stop_codon:yes gene_type:complete
LENSLKKILNKLLVIIKYKNKKWKITFLGIFSNIFKILFFVYLFQLILGLIPN